MSSFRLFCGFSGVLAFSVIACSPMGARNSGSSSSAASGAGFAVGPANFRLSLTDKPSDEAKAVFVNVRSVEILVEKSGKQSRIVLAQNLGMVDLLQLRNNVFKTLGDLQLPDGLVIHQMRMNLGADNHLVKLNNSTCDLATPSAQQSGVKLLFTPSLTIDSRYTYTVALDFDVDKSIVIKGNGGCSLKPVIKVKSVERVALPVTPPAAGDNQSGGSSGSTGSSGSADNTGSTGSSGTSSGDTASGGGTTSGDTSTGDSSTTYDQSGGSTSTGGTTSGTTSGGDTTPTDGTVEALPVNGTSDGTWVEDEWGNLPTYYDHG